MRACVPLLPDAQFLKLYSQQLNQIGFQDSFSKNTINCELKIFSNEWDFWKKFKIKPSVKERRMWVQLVSGQVYLASSGSLPHLWGKSINPLFSATSTTDNKIHSK